MSQAIRYCPGWARAVAGGEAAAWRLRCVSLAHYWTSRAMPCFQPFSADLALARGPTPAAQSRAALLRRWCSPLSGCGREQDVSFWDCSRLLAAGVAASGMQLTAWAPRAGSVPCSRGYTERHVFRVAHCPQYQFLRGLGCWQARPVAVRAISEELVQREHAETLLMNGASLDHLADIPPRQQSTDTTLVHAGERAGRPRVADALTTPIVQTSTFTFR